MYFTNQPSYHFLILRFQFSPILGCFLPASSPRQELQKLCLLAAAAPALHCAALGGKTVGEAGGG